MIIISNKCQYFFVKLQKKNAIFDIDNCHNFQKKFRCPMFDGTNGISEFKSSCKTNAGIQLIQRERWIFSDISIRFVASPFTTIVSGEENLNPSIRKRKRWIQLKRLKTRNVRSLKFTFCVILTTSLQQLLFFSFIFLFFCFKLRI